MKVKIKKVNLLKGTIEAIGSKSFAHRLLIASFLSKKGTINNVPNSNDISATLNCLEALGAIYSYQNNTISFQDGYRLSRNIPLLDCLESGSTIRFMVPIALALTDRIVVKGSKRLIERGIDGYLDIFNKSDISYLKNETAIELTGKLKPGKYQIQGSTSSQYITGLLMSLPLLDGDSVLEVIPPINSKNYIDITLDVLKTFGIKIDKQDNTYFIKGNQKYQNITTNVEGDYSNSAFLESFNYFNNNIRVTNLNPSSLQGDRIYQELFRLLNDSYQEIDVSNCIDLCPILFAFASLKNGAKFIGTERLKIKESDRASAMKEELTKVGIDVDIYDNYVEIKKQNITPCKVVFSSHNDHRIVMALSLLSTVMDIEIEDYEAINKSYPHYFKDLEKLGAEIIYE